jgi:hypothetical protein
MQHLWRTAATVCLFLLAGLAGVGCGQKGDAPPAGFAPEAAQDPPAQRAARGPEGEPAEKAKEASPRKIIYTADVRLMVEDFARAEKALEQLVDANKGYIIKSVIQGSPGARRSGEWKVRVPAESFRSFQAALAKLGELQSSTLDSQDVTEEFYDLKTRIKNREAAEAALREMYKKATKIEEMLPINDKIREVRLEIEREQGRLQLLTKLTEMTTVTVHIQERVSFVPPEAASFGTRADRTFSDSTGALEAFGQGLALFLVALAPWLPLVAVVAVPAWLLVRRARARAAAQVVTLVDVPQPSPPPASPPGPTP